MNSVFEKIIEKLEERRMLHADLAQSDKLTEQEREVQSRFCGCFCKAIEIVKKEAEQYNNGWITCSEKLPELRQDVLVTVKYTGFMGMYGYWIKTGHMEAENDWWGDCAGGEVIAWKPLPLPFQNGDNNENS